MSSAKTLSLQTYPIDVFAIQFIQACHHYSICALASQTRQALKYRPQLASDTSSSLSYSLQDRRAVDMRAHTTGYIGRCTREEERVLAQLGTPLRQLLQIQHFAQGHAPESQNVLVAMVLCTQELSAFRNVV